MHNLSLTLIPAFIFLVIINAAITKHSSLESFQKGVRNGLNIVVQVAPTILALFFAIGIFRSSGAFSLLCKLISPIATRLHIPSALLPLAILKTFSSSGANGVLFDLFKTYGTDSYIGFAASILLSCTESLFYTISLYMMSIGITKTRFLIPLGILVSIFSFLISLIIARFYFPS